MRGLLKAGVLLAPALAGAVALEEDSISSAIITLRLPEATADSAMGHDLTFQFNILESNDACGYGNVTIEGQDLPEGGSGSLVMKEDIVDASWNFTCVAWNGKPQEQLLSLNIETINGQPIEDVGFTLRFQQVAPVWISDIEGDASMTRLHSLRQAGPKHNCDDNDDNDDNDEIDPDAELAELDYLRWQVAELSHEIRAKEQRLADVLGWDRHIQDCDSLKCVIGTVVHKMKGAVKSVYGGERHHGPHGPQGKHHGDKGMHFPQHEGHGNHTEDGPHPPPPPPHGRPSFPHPPPFCKCAPSPPLHGGHHPPPRPDEHVLPPPPGFGPPPHPGEHPPPPPKGDAHAPPPGFGPPPPHHGEHPPPPPPPVLYPEEPDLIKALYDFIHPGPPPMPEGNPHREWHQQFDEPERPHSHEGKPHPQGHEDHKSFDDVAQPDIESEKQDKDGNSATEASSQPGEGLDHPSIDEFELRRDYEHGPPRDAPPPPPPHDRPHNAPGLAGPPPPPPPPPPPHRPPPHGPILIHVASALVSLILFGVFGSVLYQRYVRKSIRTPRRHRGYSSAPWYKKMCFGPHYYEISEDEEKEAMLRGSDEESDNEDGDEDLVARDISQFRTAADVVSEMVAVEDGRMMGHSPQPSQVIPAPMASAAAPMMHQMQTYTPTNAVPVPMSNAQMTVDPATMAAMFPDLHHDDEMAEELPAYQEADRDSETDADEFASSIVSDGYRPGCAGASYTPSESGSQGASDILGDTKN